MPGTLGAAPSPRSPAHGNVYAQAETPSTNVVSGRFGPRNQPATPLPDPLEAERYASLSAAMTALFDQFSGRLSDANRALIEQRLLEGDLRKELVAELAATLSHLHHTTGATA